MRQSIGMSQQLNIIVIFILVVFALIAASLSYYKAFKVNNVIINSLEKYEGYNSLSEKEIEIGLKSLGYQKINGCLSRPYEDQTKKINTNGYCVNYKENNNGYSYQVVTYMYIDLPVVNVIKVPVKSNTKRMCLGKGLDACN